MNKLLVCPWIVLFVLMSVRGALAAPPGPGDIAVIGLHADAKDSFAWVTLVDLEPGQQVFFTDAGWFDGGVVGISTVSDGSIRYTAPATGLPAGTVQLVTLQGTSLPEGYVLVESKYGPAMLAGTFGDQLVVFSGSTDNPLNIFALNTNSSSWGTKSPPNYAAESLLPPGVKEGLSAVAVGAGPNPGEEYDNARYVGISRGTKEELAFALADPDNWEGSDDPIGDITNGTLAPGFQILDPALFTRGNVNNDSDTDISDAVTILLALFVMGKELDCLDAADVNDDSVIEITDSILILEFLYAGGPPPATPFGECGPDMTVDRLDCADFPSCP